MTVLAGVTDSIDGGPVCNRNGHTRERGVAAHCLLNLTLVAPECFNRTMSPRLLASLALTSFVLLLSCTGDDSSGDTAAGNSVASSTGASTGDPGSEGDTQPDPPADTGSSSEGGETSPPADSSGGGGTDGSSEGGTTGAAAPTWDNFGSAFFESYCWECHGAGDPQGRDYSELSGVLPEAASIRCGTGPVSNPPADCAGEPPAGQFPIGATVPTDEERQTLVDWIDAGAPES